MKFEPMLVKPQKGDPYFTTINNGGYSRCIEGKPVDPDCNVLSNCVGLALGIFHKRANCPAFNLIDAIDAGGLVENAKAHGLRTGMTPELGALIVWKVQGTDKKGHVASVEEIGIGGEITTAESGWNASKPFWQGHYKSPYKYHKENYIFQGFIYLPETPPIRALRKGDKGAEVELMQSRLCERGYLRKTEIDGSFGRITLGAVLCFQFEHGLAVDGVCGPKTQAALTE